MATQRTYVSKTVIQEIAEAIREKTNSTDSISPREMADLILNINTEPQTEEIEFITDAELLTYLNK